jgi:hypothetical protein
LRYGNVIQLIRCGTQGRRIKIICPTLSGPKVGRK